MKDDSVYLQHVLRCIARIEEYAAAGRESFFSSPLIQDGVIRSLQTLAESGQRLSEAIKGTYPEVDWKGLAGFRNVLVHDYLGVDVELVDRAVEQDVPRLKRVPARRRWQDEGHRRTMTGPHNSGCTGRRPRDEHADSR